MEEDPGESIVCEPAEQAARSGRQAHAQLPDEPAEVHVPLGVARQQGVGCATVLADERPEGEFGPRGQFIGGCAKRHGEDP